MKYKNSSLNVSQIAEELKVGPILEGSLRKAENKARITVQLVDAYSQKHLWSEDYNRELTNEKEQIGKKGTDDIEAYRNYLLGNYFLNKRTGDDLTIGTEYFNKAVEYDPRFALAYAGLANCYTLLGGASYGNGYQGRSGA